MGVFMKTRALLLGASALIALSGTADAAHNNGWYISLEAGASAIQDWQTVSDNVTHSHVRDYGFDTGWAVMGSVGYAFHSSNWRLELEAGYRDNNFDGNVHSDSNPGPIFDFVDNRLDGVTEFSVMANVLYDIPLSNKWSLSLGAGAGWDRVNITWGPGLFDAADFRDWQFAYQGIVGLNYAIASRWDLFVNYRYLNVAAPDLDFGPYNLHPLTDSEDLTKHAVTIGLRYDLSPDEVPPPPPPPYVPPPPPPPVKHFVIFFGFGKCNVTAEADSVLSEAAAAAKSGGSASVSIVGHTDTVGSPKANQKLSECRADAAKSNMVGKGVPAGAISTSGKGESELMVQTGDNVKEPQNRRANIDLN